MVIRLLLVAAAIYVAIALLFFLMQRKMLYMPEDHRPDPQVLATMGLNPWPEAGDRLRGWIAEPEAPARGTVAVFHGNAGGAWQRDYYARALTARDYRVILVEYPGYSGRGGRLTESGLVADGLASTRALRDRFQGPLFLLGESLGAGVVGGIVREAPGLADGLVLITPWDRLREVAGRHYPWLPVGIFLKDRYDNLRNLRGYRGPVAVLLAEHDGIVPPAHAEHLYRSLQTRKHLWRFPDAGHNSWPVQASASWWDEVLDFLSRGTDVDRT